VYVSIISPSGHYYLHVHIVRMHPHHTLVEAAIGVRLQINSAQLNSFMSGSCVPLLSGARKALSGDGWILSWGQMGSAPKP
jgi:hypothetical protein